MEQLNEEKEVIEEEINIIEKKGFLTTLRNIWNKTIFSDWLKDKKEEKEFRRIIRREAKQQALFELKDKMIEKYKQDELDKMIGVKKENTWLSKIGKELKTMGDNAGKNLSSGNAFGGMSGGTNISDMLGTGKINSAPKEESVRYVYVNKKGKKLNRHILPPKQKEENYEDKIKRLLK